MMIGLLVAGIVAIVAGVLAIAYGFLLDLSFGNTLILAGAFGVCSGMIVLAQTLVVQELRNLGRKLSSRMATEARARAGVGEEAFAPPRELSQRDFGAAMETDAPPLPSASALPWREDAIPRDRMRQEPAVAPSPEMAELASPPSRRRNLMFSSNVRKDRERPPLPGEPAAGDELEPPESGDASAGGFGDAWPLPERMRPSEVLAQRRATRTALGEARGTAPPEWSIPREEPLDDAAVTVIKSGIVDGMGYSLYSDGSIEAQLPEGMMRFASIDDLRAHLDQRA
jgi:hypothetical protein